MPITQETAQKIIDRYCTGETATALAAEYGLQHTSVCNIISGRTWKQCRRPDNIRELIRGRLCLFEKGRKCHIDAPPLTEVQTDVLVGSLLGDGGVYGRGTCHFSKAQVHTRKAYLDWHMEILRPYGSKIDDVYSSEVLVGGKSGVIIDRIKTEKRLSGYSLRTHQHPVFTELRHKWYPAGKKIVPVDLTLNPLRVAIWFFDDGSNNVKQRNAVLCTQGFTLDEADFLSDKLKDMDIQPRIIKVLSRYTGREMPMLKFSKTSYDNLIHMIQPYCLWECMRYKVEWRDCKPRYIPKHIKLNEEQVEEIRRLAGTVSQAKLSKMFEVAQTTISAIIRKVNWK